MRLNCFLWVSGGANADLNVQIFVKVLIDMSKSLSFRNEIVWLFESRSDNFITKLYIYIFIYIYD